MRVRIPVTALVLVVVLVSLLLPAFGTATPAEAGPNDPSVYLSTSYTSIIAGKGKEIAFPVSVVNRGTNDELVNISVTNIPQDWQAFLKDKDKGYVVRSMFLTAGISQTVTFQARPPADTPPGDYKFTIQSVTQSGIKHSLDITVGIEAQALSGIRLVTFYPLLRGPSTTSFDFTVDLINDSDDERSVGITTTQPPDWRVSLRPTGEAKEISGLRLKGGESKGLAITINPASRATAGEYNIELQAVSGEYKANLKLTVVLLGNYELAMNTPSGQLNANVTAGTPSNLTIQVTNKGSAEIKDVSLTASKPQDWEVVFTPDKLDVLAPGQTREIPVRVTPSAEALAGDYELIFTSTGGSASSNIKIRTTVETPTTWGWVGLGTVVLVVVGLVGMFVRMGRR